MSTLCFCLLLLSSMSTFLYAFGWAIVLWYCSTVRTCDENCKWLYGQSKWQKDKIKTTNEERKFTWSKSFKNILFIIPKTGLIVNSLNREVFAIVIVDVEIGVQRLAVPDCDFQNIPHSMLMHTYCEYLRMKYTISFIIYRILTTL